MSQHRHQRPKQSSKPCLEFFAKAFLRSSVTCSRRPFWVSLQSTAVSKRAIMERLWKVKAYSDDWLALAS